MLLDSGAKLTKPKCLLATGALRNGICPGPMGIHSHSCCGKGATSSEASTFLASWPQVQLLPLRKRDRQSLRTCWQSTESSWGLPQTSFLEPASWRTTGSDWVSELCLLSNSIEGWGGGARGCRSSVLTFMETTVIALLVMQDGEGPQILRKQLKML